MQLPLLFLLLVCVSGQWFSRSTSVLPLSSRVRYGPAGQPRRPSSSTRPEQVWLVQPQQTRATHTSTTRHLSPTIAPSFSFQTAAPTPLPLAWSLPTQSEPTPSILAFSRVTYGPASTEASGSLPHSSVSASLLSFSAAQATQATLAPSTFPFLSTSFPLTSFVPVVNTSNRTLFPPFRPVFQNGSYALPPLSPLPLPNISVRAFALPPSSVLPAAPAFGTSTLGNGSSLWTPPRAPPPLPTASWPLPFALPNSSWPLPSTPAVLPVNSSVRFPSTSPLSLPVWSPNASVFPLTASNPILPPVVFPTFNATTALPRPASFPTLPAALPPLDASLLPTPAFPPSAVWGANFTGFPLSVLNASVALPAGRVVIVATGSIAPTAAPFTSPLRSPFTTAVPLFPPTPAYSAIPGTSATPVGPMYSAIPASPTPATPVGSMYSAIPSAPPTSATPVGAMYSAIPDATPTGSLYSAVPKPATTPVGSLYSAVPSSSGATPSGSLYSAVPGATPVGSMYSTIPSGKTMVGSLYSVSPGTALYRQQGTGKKVASFDFDGTLHSAASGALVGTPYPHVIAALIRYAQDGNDIVITTSRSSLDNNIIQQFLDQQGIAKYVKKIYNSPSGDKTAELVQSGAFVHVDDRAANLDILKKTLPNLQLIHVVDDRMYPY